MKIVIKIKGIRQIVYLLFPVFFLLAGGCRNKQQPLDIPQLVKLAKVDERGATASVTYPGKIEAASNVKLAFRVAGPLSKVYVSEGQSVKRGQLLAALDARDYRLQFNGTQAEYKQVTGESDRIIELYRMGSVSVNDYDKAVSAKERITALYHAHSNALNDTKLHAPFDGYIQNRYFDAPEIINQGTPVLSMINNDYLEVGVDIPATDFVRRNDFVGFSAVADIFPDSVFPLELLDINQGANYNQLYHARFRLKKGQHSGLTSGMSLAVTIGFKPSGGDEHLIPVSALFEKEGKSYVWLYDENRHAVHAIPVEVKQLSKDGQAVVKSALRSGQSIVSAGVNSLKEGQKVTPLPPVSPSNIGGLL